jgi:hypothetical protein
MSVEFRHVHPLYICTSWHHALAQCIPEPYGASSRRVVCVPRTVLGSREPRLTARISHPPQTPHPHFVLVTNGVGCGNNLAGAVPPFAGKLLYLQAYIRYPLSCDLPKVRGVISSIDSRHLSDRQRDSC